MLIGPHFLLLVCSVEKPPYLKSKLYWLHGVRCSEGFMHQYVQKDKTQV